MDEIESSSDRDLSLKYILALFKNSLDNKEKKSITLVNPIQKESSFRIENIINLLERHFNYKYKHRGAALLPVIACYSVYQCLIIECQRYQNKKLDPLASHNSSDKKSVAIGDIIVRDSNNNIYEAVEVKFNIPITQNLLYDSYQKIALHPVQRFYLLSTAKIRDSEKDSINTFIDKIENEHGCQFIANGLLSTLNYYLRLLTNTDKFMQLYIENLQSNNEIKYEHKLAWNEIIKTL